MSEKHRAFTWVWEPGNELCTFHRGPARGGNRLGLQGSAQDGPRRSRWNYLMDGNDSGGFSDSDVTGMMRTVSCIVYASGRRCEGCGCFLRQENGGKVCAPCREKEFWTAWRINHQAGDYYTHSITPQTIARFWALCRTGTPRKCWGWRGPTNHSGLPVFSSERTIYQARRVSFAIHSRELPQGVFIVSQCRKKICCNPKHLAVAAYSRRNGKHRLA